MEPRYKRDSKQSTTAYHLAKIVWIHKRIVMKCSGSHIDALLQDMTITVASHQLLTNSEDKLFKLLILNAISGPIWVCFDTLFISILHRISIFPNRLISSSWRISRQNLLMFLKPDVPCFGVIRMSPRAQWARKRFSVWRENTLWR